MNLLKSVLLCGALIFPALASGGETMTPGELFDALYPTFQKHRISEAEVCVNGACETFPLVVDRGRVVSDKPGADDTVGADGHTAAAVGEILGVAGKQVGAGGRVVLDYEKRPDGTFKVHVEASFGVGSAAAAAASAAPPPKDDK